MLDWPHTLMLRGVAKGIPDGNDPAPALRRLIAAGLVARSGDRTYAVTAEGRVALGEAPEGDGARREPPR